MKILWRFLIILFLFNSLQADEKRIAAYKKEFEIIRKKAIQKYSDNEKISKLVEKINKFQKLYSNAPKDLRLSTPPFRLLKDHYKFNLQKVTSLLDCRLKRLDKEYAKKYKQYLKAENRKRRVESELHGAEVRKVNYKKKPRIQAKKSPVKKPAPKKKKK
jgi:hypothetical protein